jgi:hypothetical protein
MNALGQDDMRFDRFNQRLQRRRAGADPIGQRRDVELNVLVRVGCDLPIERQM